MQNLDFDQIGINHFSNAVRLAMTPKLPKGADTDTLYIGGPQPSFGDQSALARFGLSKNYNIVFACFDLARVSDGPVGFEAVLTDGVTEAISLSGGRIWKRNSSSPAILVFPDSSATLQIHRKGRLSVRRMAGLHHDEGFELARCSLLAEAARKPGNLPILSTIGSMPIVMDMQTMIGAFAAAA